MALSIRDVIFTQNYKINLATLSNVSDNLGPLKTLKCPSPCAQSNFQKAFKTVEHSLLQFFTLAPRIIQLNVLPLDREFNRLTSMHRWLLGSRGLL